MIAGSPNVPIEIELFLGAVGEASFNKLRRFFDGLGGEKSVEMIGHEDEFVQIVFLLIAIVEQNVEEETRHFVGLEYWSPLSAGRRYEIGIQNRYLGAKAPVSGNLDAGLKASSTVSGQVQSP